jgi:hypothetical protein
MRVVILRSATGFRLGRPGKISPAPENPPTRPLIIFGCRKFVAASRVFDRCAPVFCEEATENCSYGAENWSVRTQKKSSSTEISPLLAGNFASGIKYLGLRDSFFGDTDTCFF